VEDKRQGHGDLPIDTDIRSCEGDLSLAVLVRGQLCFKEKANAGLGP
jgi:hypothetical protein